MYIFWYICTCRHDALYFSHATCYTKDTCTCAINTLCDVPLLITHTYSKYRGMRLKYFRVVTAGEPDMQSCITNSEREVSPDDIITPGIYIENVTSCVYSLISCIYIILASVSGLPRLPFTCAF